MFNWTSCIKTPLTWLHWGLRRPTRWCSGRSIWCLEHPAKITYTWKKLYILCKFLYKCLNSVTKNLDFLCYMYFALYIKLVSYKTYFEAQSIVWRRNVSVAAACLVTVTKMPERSWSTVQYMQLPSSSWWPRYQNVPEVQYSTCSCLPRHGDQDARTFLKYSTVHAAACLVTVIKMPELSCSTTVHAATCLVTVTWLFQLIRRI